MKGVEAPSYLSPENSHVIESLSNRRQKGGKLSVTVPMFLRLIEAPFLADASLEASASRALPQLVPQGLRVQGKLSWLCVRIT
jgi:hypothetical protein